MTVDAVTIDAVTKRYRIGVGRARIREAIPPPIDRAVARMAPRWWAKDSFKVLDDVSLSVPDGEAVGIVGHNGAGKTTLLKVIAGVTTPDTGRVVVGRRIGALIDALVGFHPDLTGRENVFLLGSMHGFSHREMAPRIDRVLEFAEISEMADTPLKRFSAGMAARLGFATITALDVDVLLVDEILAVGDTNFQRKCINWLDDFRNGGGTLLFVSHNLGLVRNMTRRAVWIDAGKVMAEGATGEVLAAYGAAMERRVSGDPRFTRRGTDRIMTARGLDRWGSGEVRVEEVHVSEPTEEGTLEAQITYGATGVASARFCLGLMDESGRELGSAVSPAVSLEASGGVARCRIERLPLHAGLYFPVVAIVSESGATYDRWKLDRAVVVERPEGFQADLGPVDIGAAWTTKERP